jgi:hypothetical protein
MMKYKIFLFTCLFPYAVAAQELSTDRPDQTEAPFVIPYRTVQIETGFLNEQQKTSKSMEMPALLLRAAISETMELRFIVTHVKNKISGFETKGIEPVEAGFKIKICEEKGFRPHIGFIQHLVFPWLASPFLKENFYGIKFRFAAQHTLTEKLNLSYNAGMEWYDGVSKGNFVYTLASGIGITEKLSGFAEIFGNIPEKSSGTHRFDGGLAYLLFPTLQLDISAGADFKNTADNFFLNAGISWRFSTGRNSK